jgi:S1-C subfamily serine protease
MLGLRSGGRELVVTSVANGGPAAAAGLRVGDVIERIGGRPAGEQLRQSGSFAAAESLDIRRGGKPAIVNLQLGNRSSG